eukprot:6099959-Amphidinium_carterae.1
METRKTFTVRTYRVCRWLFLWGLASSHQRRIRNKNFTTASFHRLLMYIAWCESSFFDANACQPSAQVSTAPHL